MLRKIPMGMRLRSCACVLLLLAPSARAVELSSLVGKVKPSVVFLEIIDSSGTTIGNGTGFVVSADGQVVTNAHVVRPAYDMRAKLADGSVRAVLGLLATDEVHDVAIVKLEGGGYSSLELGDSSTLTEGSPVAVIGNPLGLSWTYTEGKVSALRRELPADMAAGISAKGPFVQIAALIAPGSSGSPVFTEDARVIGVAQSGFATGAPLGFAVPIEMVKELRKTIREGVAPQPFHSFPLKNLVFSIAFYGGLAGAVLWYRARKRKAVSAPIRFRA